MTDDTKDQIAYFSMEIAVDPDFPTYAGGLGVLAGDMLRSAADAGLPILGVTLLDRQGYFRQELDGKGQQIERPEEWRPEEKLEPTEPIVSLNLNGRRVQVQAWRHWITGITGHRAPVYFLDSDLPENDPWDCTPTNSLYGGDETYRLCQETILGIGGVHLLRALGYHRIARFHTNEGHSEACGDWVSEPDVDA